MEGGSKMNSIVDRGEIWERHPVKLRQITYPTQASEHLLRSCEHAIRARTKGFVVVSKPLMGLTTALRILVAGWPKLYSGIPIALVRSPGATVYHPVRFWSSLVTQLIPNLATWRNPDALRLGLLRNLLTRANAHDSDRLLLIVDRAHTLLPEELLQLAVFQDDLADEGTNLVVALAGYESLRTIRDCLHDEAREEPVRRYFENEHYLYGIRSSQELAYFLESFDKCRFPQGSEWPISRFCFPKAFDRGWRLWHEAARAWSIFSGYAIREGEPAEVEMQYVTETACSLLESAYQRGSGALPPDEDAWRIAVQSSGLISSRAMLSQMPESKAPRRRR